MRSICLMLACVLALTLSGVSTAADGASEPIARPQSPPLYRMHYATPLRDLLFGRWAVPVQPAPTPTYYVPVRPRLIFSPY